MVLSAMDGHPCSPSSAETAPSCIWPPADSEPSSSCSASRRPVTELYWSARRRMPASATGRPSSEKAAAPLAASSPISLKLRPCWPRVIAHMNPVAITASVRA